MKPFEGYKAEKAQAGTDALPAGAYIAQIKAAEVCEYSWGDVLLISFDIAEGEFKGHFAKRWKNDAGSSYGQRWKGTFRLNIPSAKSKYPDSDKRAFGNAMWAIEQSNRGYSWDWKEELLKGKRVGVLFRNREWEMNGQTGWTTECCTLLSVQDVRDGNFSMPKDKPLKAKEQAQQTQAPAKAIQDFDDIISDGELPF